MAQYWTCRYGANHDLGERCDCEFEELNRKLAISETLLVGIDISAGEDISVVQVVRRSNYNGGEYKVINSFCGEEAERIYQMLIKNQRHRVIFEKGEAQNANNKDADGSNTPLC